MTDEHLDPSKLGTKQYWDQAYALESTNFTSDPTDEGQVWFSESNAESRILTYLRRAAPDATSFLDIGAGNGHLLFELLEEGFSGTLVGVDYSEHAVSLAKSIAKARGVGEGQGQVEFYVVDVMQMRDCEEWAPPGGFQVCLDKGTFDAISLSDGMLEDGRRVYEGYAEHVVGVMKRGGLLVITSCNWTEDELRRKILVTGELEYHGRIEYPSFSFGGRKGQTISSVCFRRK